MACKDCIHFDMCYMKSEHKEFYCDYFKDKSKLIELPCNRGDILYFVDKGKLTVFEIIDIIYYGTSGNCRVRLQNKDDDADQVYFSHNHLINYKLFRTREEAERALLGYQNGKE